MNTNRRIEPYEQGMEASMSSKPASDNPYREGTSAGEEWLEGWKDGETSWEALCAQEMAAGRSRPQG